MTTRWGLSALADPAEPQVPASMPAPPLLFRKRARTLARIKRPSMAKERLSKLQKRILFYLYAQAKADPKTSAAGYPGMVDYVGLLRESAKEFGTYRTSPVSGRKFLEPSYRVTFSRSIYSMWRKGLISAKLANEFVREATEDAGNKYRELAARRRFRVTLMWLNPKGLKLISDINNKARGKK